MTKIGIGYVSPLKRMLDEIPDRQELVDFEQVKEMRMALGIGVMDSISFLKKCASVTEAIDLYHKTRMRLIEEEAKETRFEMEMHGLVKHE